MLRLCLVSVAIAAAACTTPEPVFEGETFVAQYWQSWADGCPRFDDRSAPRITVLFEGDVVTVDGVEATEVSMQPADELGGYDVTFRIGQDLVLNDAPVPASIRFEGYAGFDILTLRGGVTFTEPERSSLASCVMKVDLVGDYQEAPEWRH